MASARSWFQKFRHKEDKVKAGPTRNKETVSTVESTTEEVPSNTTQQKVAAAKDYIENHYKSQMKCLQDRKERRWMLERKLADADVNEEDQINLLKYLERKETEYMRIQRHKMGVDDFELLTIIGRGAFGEVRLCREKSTGQVYAMKKLKKSEMLRRGQMIPSQDTNFVGYTYKNYEIVKEHHLPGIAELKKKSTKLKRPSVKALFDMPDSPEPLVPGSFLNRLPTQIEVSEIPEPLPRYSRPSQHQPQSLRRQLIRCTYQPPVHVHV